MSKKHSNVKVDVMIHKLDVITEKLNLTRLDTFVLSGFLLPLSLLCIGLITNWLERPPFSTLLGLNLLFMIVEGMAMVFFVPLLIYAHAYLSDSMTSRLMAIKTLLLALPSAGSVVLFLGVEILVNFLKLKLPEYSAVLNYSIGAFVFVFVALIPIAAFGFSYIMLSRLINWLNKSLPKRMKRERLRLTPFSQLFVTIHPVMFALFAYASVAGLVACYVLLTVAVEITSPLQYFWQEPLIVMWLIAIVPLSVFSMGIPRLVRAFARSYEIESRITEKQLRRA